MQTPPDSPKGFSRLTFLSRMFRRLPPVGAAPLPPEPNPDAVNAEIQPIANSARQQSDDERTLYAEARRQIERRAWGHAQRTLEEASRREPDSPAALDLSSVRTIRRCQQRVARWPSDIESRLSLGRAYFDLDLGESALAEFLWVQRIDPNRSEGYVLAAIEYLYRGEYNRAMSTWLRARAVDPDLPEFDQLLADLPIHTAVGIPSA